MKRAIVVILAWSLNLPAYELFVEPGVFVSILDNSKATFRENETEHEGVLRNSDLSYALKFGAKIERFEFGIESEIYNFAGHFGGENGEDDLSKHVQITYNSVFAGYEFAPGHNLYLAVSSNPHMRSDGNSFTEPHNVVSLEYSKHLKDWLSLNVKFETESNLSSGGHSKREFGFKNLFLMGFSFPLTAASH